MSALYSARHVESFDTKDYIIVKPKLGQASICGAIFGDVFNMEKLILQVRGEREALTAECFRTLGWMEVSLSKESDTSPVTNTVWVRQDEESLALTEKRARCQAVLGEIEAIDRRVERYYLERVVLVGMAGAACIGLSFLFLHLGLHILFTISLLLGMFGCSITLALRPLLTRIGLRKLGGDIPALEAKLRMILAEEEG